MKEVFGEGNELDHNVLFAKNFPTRDKEPARTTLGSTILQVIFAGVTVGMIYSLIALGFHLIYKGTGIVNFAQGEFALLGSMLMWFFWVKLGLNGFVSFGLTITGSILFAVMAERVMFAPLRKQPHLTLVMVLLAVATLYTQGMLFAFGHDPVSIPPFFGKGSLQVLGAGLSSQTLFVASVFIISLFMVQTLFTKTMWGRSMVATMINEEGAKLVGINVDLVSLYAFGLSAALSGAAGALVAPITGAYYAKGFVWCVKGFTAGMVGGIETTMGVVVGGLLVGLVEISIAVFASPELADISVFAVLIMILLIRPAGIMGGKGG